MVWARFTTRQRSQRQMSSCDNAERKNLRRFAILAIMAVSLEYRYASLLQLSRCLSSKQSHNTASPNLMDSLTESTPTSVICDTEIKDEARTIRSYLSLMDHPDDWVLLKWKPDGTFDRDLAQTKSHYQQWHPSAELLGDTLPSEFGRIVLLLNSDRLPLIPWHIRPPIPVWVYSQPTSAVDPRVQNVTDPPGRCDLPQVTLVPTPYDTGNWNKNCVETVQRRVQKQNFHEKINTIVWRGVIHSLRAEKSRLAAVELAKAHPNATFLDIVEVSPKGKDNRLDMYELADYRYHLDLGGLSGTAWGGLRWKLCSGVLVFKVDSWAEDWWYQYLEPWKHYIPVRADVSDLMDHYQWTQDNPEETEQIAKAGQEKCLETLGPDNAKAYYRKKVQQIPVGEQSFVEEADLILQSMQQNNDVGLNEVITLISVETS